MSGIKAIVAGQEKTITRVPMLVNGVDKGWEVRTGDGELLWGAKRTITGTTPMTLKGYGIPLDVCNIIGNGSQSGTPTPDNIIMPTFCGVRTGNLFDKLAQPSLSNKYLNDNGTANSKTGWYVSDYIEITGDYVTVSGISGNTPSICAYNAQKAFVRGEAYNTGGATILGSCTISVAGCKYIRFSYISAILDTAMLNTGSTVLPYEPYGYKIPLTCAGQTTPVYLGQVSTVRRVKKLVLTGNETYQEYSYSGTNGVQISNMLETAYRRANGLCNIYPVSTVAGSTSCLWIGSGGSDRNLYFVSILSVMGLTDAADFKSWVTQKYAAGTPVTVWYVLKTPKTAIVNEPLAKIGDYADELHSEDAGITIPTAKGNNTLTVDTELQPSQISVTGHIKSIS